MSVKSTLRIARTIEFNEQLRLTPKGGTGSKLFHELDFFRKSLHLDIPQPTQQFCIRGMGNLPKPGHASANSSQGEWSRDNPHHADKMLILTLKWVAMCLDLELDHATPWSETQNSNWTNIRVIPKSINRLMSNDATLSNEEINTLIAGLSPEMRRKLNIPEWFYLPNENGVIWLQGLKYEYFEK